MDNQTQNQMVLSQMNQEEYTHIVTHQEGQGRLKRRRKRSRPENETAAWRKRKLNAEQLNLLEISFENEHKLESERKYRLASELGLDPRTVSVWFQNRRARWKSKKMEEEYSSLKKEHESAVADNSQLESQIKKLKEQLSEAEMEIKRLWSNSPSSSMTMDGADEAQFIGEFGYQDELYMQENINVINGMEWVNLYN